MSARRVYQDQLIRFRPGQSSEKDAKQQKDTERKRVASEKRRLAEIEAGTVGIDKRRRVGAVGPKVSMKDKVLEQIKIEYQNTLRQVLGDEVHVYYISKRKDYEDAIHQIQDSTGLPVDEESDEFRKLDTKWIHAPGIHIGIDDGDMSIIFMVHIWQYKDMPAHRQSLVHPILKNVMDWTFAVPAIKNNGAHKKRGNRKGEPEGSMFAFGWHGGMESGKKVVWYAPGSSKEAIKEFSSLTEEKAKEICIFYRDGLAALYPAGFQKLHGFAQENKIVGFQQLDASSEDLLSYATSLIITRDDFSNFQHRDKDKVDLAYGLWWAGLWDESTQRYVISDACDHDKVHGGSFLFSEYGYGIRFERCQGLVEVTWRGSKDLHSTMKSRSMPLATRFGTSVQITSSASQSMKKWRDEGSQASHVITHQDRIDAKRT